jgi:ABC-2 type transport system ATP-binding protein
MIRASPVLSAAHLTRSFGDRVAVDDVSFDLAPGEIFGLLGPNGGGKTTMLRMLAGLIGPSSGHVELDGAPVNKSTSARLRKRIGFLTEAPGLWDSFTIHQNLLIYAKLHELPSPAREVDRALELFDVRDRANDKPAMLSKGLRQRVALARALLHDPQIVLLDEPTSGLDPESAHGVRQLILRLRHEKRLVILSTHNLDEVERIADRVAVLRSRLLAIDSPVNLRRKVFGRWLRITLAQPAGAFADGLGAGAHVTVDGNTLTIDLSHGAATAPQLVRHLVEAGADVESVSEVQPPLEDVYLKLLHLKDGHA